MNNRHILSIAAAALLGLTACSEQMEPQGAPGSRAVRLAASTTTLTRAADGIYSAESGFTGDEQVEVFMNSADRHATYQLAAAAGGTSAMSSATPLDYPEESGDVTLYAVYPATSQTSHTVAHDQTGADGYRQSDLMFAKTVVSDAQRDAEQTLVFQHQLVKLKVVVTKPADISILGGITLQNVKRKVGVTLAPAGLTVGTAEAADDGAGNSILVSGAEDAADTEQTYTYACVLPETTWGADDTFITATVDGQQVDYKLGSETTLSAGSEYTLTMTVSNNGMDANTASLSAWGTLTQATVAALTAANALVIEGDIADQTWSKTGAQPAIGTVKTAAGVTVSSSDYDISYYNNTTVTDEAFVVVTGKGSHAGKVGYKAFRIVQKSDGAISYAETTLTKSKNDVFTNPLTNTGDGTVTYESDNTAVATVNSVTGEVTAVASGTAKITATVTNSSNCTYTTATASYDLTVPKNPSSITADDIANNRGTSEKPRAWVICEDGDMHLCQDGTEVDPSSSSGSPVYLSSSGTVDGTLSCGKKKVAVVCYVNTAGSVDKSTGSSGYRGLAIAIEDANGGSTCAWYTANSGTCVAQSSTIATALNTSQNDAQWWTGIDNTNQLGNGTGTCSGHTHAAAQAVLAYASASAGTGYSHAVPSGMSQWFMPTIAQWNLIVKGLTGGTADLTTSSNSAYNATAVNKYIKTAAGGSQVQSNRYWSSVEYSTNSAWSMYFSNGSAYSYYKSLTIYVRAVLAF